MLGLFGPVVYRIKGPGGPVYSAQPSFVLWRQHNLRFKFFQKISDSSVLVNLLRSCGIIQVRHIVGRSQNFLVNLKAMTDSEHLRQRQSLHCKW